MQNNESNAPNGSVNGNGNGNGNGKAKQPKPPGNSNNMPSLSMDAPRSRREMTNSDMNAADNYSAMQKVLVELRVSRSQGVMGVSEGVNANIASFQLDTNYEPVPVAATSDLTPSLLAANEETYIIRGEIE
jgi:serine protease AprX